MSFYVCIYLILNEEHLTFHLQYKHSGWLANRKYDSELSYPQNHENVRLHDGNSIENATPSRGTSPIASYKAVPHPPPPGNRVTLNYFGEKYVKTGFL